MLLPEETVSQKIFIIRGHKVMLDRDLAELYGVTTKRLNEQVKRNLLRFPEDFMFKLAEEEKNEVVAICDHLIDLKFSHNLPNAFTEHGVTMLSSVLNSERAVHMSIFIVRAFIKMREMLATHKDLAHKIDEIEKIQKDQGNRLASVYSVVKQLLNEPEKPRKQIGFRPRD